MIIATVSTQRSGTKLLGNCFQNGTLVTPFGEIFNPDVPQLGSFAEFMSARGRHMARLGNKALLDGFFAQFKHVCTFPSVDIMFNQVEIPTVSWNDGGRTHALYSYLRDAGAFVISLLREPFDAFVSMKHLALAGGRAHRGNGEELSRLAARAMLDETEFLAFRDRLLWQRKVLNRDMENYESFFELDYRELRSGYLPPRLIEALVAAGRRVGHRLDPARIQTREADMKPSGVDYSTSFSNHDELRRRYTNAETDILQLRRLA